MEIWIQHLHPSSAKFNKTLAPILLVDTPNQVGTVMASNARPRGCKGESPSAWPMIHFGSIRTKYATHKCKNGCLLQTMTECDTTWTIASIRQPVP